VNLEKIIDTYKVVELKELCKEMGLKTSGKKSELQDRLREFSQGSGVQPTNIAIADDDFDQMSKEALIETAIGRGLPTIGSKQDLINRLRVDIAGVMDISQPLESGREYDIARSKILGSSTLASVRAESELKANTISKYIDVTVKSLGMKPEKYTAGGMPCVTSDVLRTLAGDPFADPPQYGTVRSSLQLLFQLFRFDPNLILLILLLINRHIVLLGMRAAKHFTASAPSVQSTR
jgi:SAP domain